MKRKMGLMTILNMVMMTVGIGTACAGYELTMVAVPEPSSILLVAAGLLGIAGIARRKK